MRFLIPAPLYCVILCTDSNTHSGHQWISACKSPLSSLPTRDWPAGGWMPYLRDAWDNSAGLQGRERDLHLPSPAASQAGVLQSVVHLCSRFDSTAWFEGGIWVILVTWTTGVIVKREVFFPPTSCSQIPGSLDGAAEGDKGAPLEMQSFLPSWNLWIARAGECSCEGKPLRFWPNDHTVGGGRCAASHTLQRMVWLCQQKMCCLLNLCKSPECGWWTWLAQICLLPYK